MREEIIHCDRCGVLIENSCHKITDTDSCGVIQEEYDLCFACSRKLMKYFMVFDERKSKEREL